MRRQAAELREQIAQVKADGKRYRQELRDSGYRVVPVFAKTAFSRPGTSTTDRDFAKGEQVAVVLLKNDLPFTFDTLCEFIRDGFLADAEKVKRRKANDAAGYGGDSLYTQRGLPDPSHRRRNR